MQGQNSTISYVMTCNGYCNMERYKSALLFLASINIKNFFRDFHVKKILLQVNNGISEDVN